MQVRSLVAHWLNLSQDPGPVTATEKHMFTSNVDVIMFVCCISLQVTIAECMPRATYIIACQIAPLG